MDITVKGNTLTITAELPEKGKGNPSKSGKTLIVACTHGKQTVTNEEGREVIVNLNAYEYRNGG